MAATFRIGADAASSETASREVLGCCLEEASLVLLIVWLWFPGFSGVLFDLL